MPAPDLKPALRDAILRSLEDPYQSRSCQDGIPTDNHYQSITLGSETTPGFRSVRDDVLDGIVLEGKTVLDLGSNLGELSRAARERGAALVDGFEYDRYFVELANAVNAYNGTTRVSFYQQDITSPDAYRERYDVVLAFSVFVYIQPLLALVTGITNELLVVETHRLEGNLADYLDPVAVHMPHHRLLGHSEWGLVGGDEGQRALIAFARSEATLERCVRLEAALTGIAQGGSWR